MNAPQPPRWHPRVVVKRWAFLLWLTPLAALLTSLIWHLLEFRQDSVTGVVAVQPRSSLSSFVGTPSWASYGGELSAFCALVHSPEMLGGVADEMDLPTLWKISRQEAVKRLQSLVSCKPTGGDALAEVEVQKTQGVNAVRLCQIVISQAVARHRSANERVIDAELASLQAEIDGQGKELNDFRARVRELIRTRGADDPDAMEQRSCFEDMQKSQEQLHLHHLTMTMEARVFKAAEIHEEPSWKSTPWSGRLSSFASRAGLVFWASLLLALGLAYLAEAIEPCRDLDEALPLS